MTEGTATSMRTFPFRIFSLTAGLTLVSIVGFYVSRQNRSDREPLGLQPSERSALYARTLEILHTTCASALEADLVAYCREQARFIARFPECGHECQSLCRRFSPRPTK